MIINNIAYWRSIMNKGKGISQAHLARRVGVGRSFVTKLEKGIGQPGAEFMLRVARYFKQPVEAIFWNIHSADSQPANICAKTIPIRQIHAFASAPARPMCNQPATPPARPAGRETVTDKSLVVPTAKAVASPVAQASHRKIK
jgi:DNA-binding XRE family transcriptional regulator